jgi:hypothetical protein
MYCAHIHNKRTFILGGYFEKFSGKVRRSSNYRYYNYIDSPSPLVEVWKDNSFSDSSFAYQDIEIANTGCSEKLYNLLNSKGISKIKQLADTEAIEVLRIKGFGKKFLLEAEKLLESYCSY